MRQRPVCVAINHEVRVGGVQEQTRRKKSDLMTVTHVYAHTTNRALERYRETGMPWWITIAHDGMNGSDVVERLEHMVSADISSVENEVHAFQRLGNAGAHQTVGVRDQSDFNVFSHVVCYSAECPSHRLPIVCAMSI